MAGLMIGKQLDILQRVAPFIGHQLHGAAAAVQLAGQAGQSLHLGLPVTVAIHGAFDAQVEGLGDLFQLSDVKMLP